MNKTLTNVLSSFIPSREARRKFRRLHEQDARASFRCADGTVAHYPIYNPAALPPGDEPEIYTASGERIHTCFLRDFHLACAVNYGSSGHLMWDRYNFGLKHHLYTHRAMLETMGHPDKRYGALFETMGVVPDDYLIFDENPGLEKNFDRIFTYSKRLLDKLPNAAFVPFCAGVKLTFHAIAGRTFPTEGLYAAKTKDVSVLSSGKTMCPLHSLRIDTARKLRRLGLADAFGTFDPDLRYVPAYDALAPYRFSVVFENSLEDYCFTEKLTNCFACQTIPIYVGPPSVGDYFNADGIIQIGPKEVTDIDSILKRATPEFYAERLPAVLDNYQRVAEYRDMTEYLYVKHMAKDF